MDTMRRDAAWSPIRYQDERLRRVSPEPEGKLKKGDRKTTTHGYARANEMGLSRVKQELLSRTITSKEGQSQRKFDLNTASNMMKEGDKKRGYRQSKDDTTTLERMHRDDSPSKFQQVSHTLGKALGSHDRRRRGPHNTYRQSKNGNTTSELLEESRRDIHSTARKRGDSKDNPKRRKSHDRDRPRRRSFRPHPLRASIRSSPWSLSFPIATESIRFNRMVLLDDGNRDISNEYKSSKLEDWLLHGSSGDIEDGSEDEDLVRRSQTVVWDNDGECVPMSEWQRTVHVSTLSFLVMFLHSLYTAIL